MYFYFKILALLFLIITSTGGGIAQRDGNIPLPLPNIPEGFRAIENPNLVISPTSIVDDVSIKLSDIRSILATVTNYPQLESAINNANSLPGSNHIIIVRPGTYNFDPPTGQNYDLNISAGVSVTLQALNNNNLPDNPDLTVLQRNPSDTRLFSLFRVAASAKLIIRNIKLASGGGSTATFSGGAVRLVGSSTANNGGILELYDSKIVGNKTLGNGGGIYVPSNAKLLITNTFFLGNEAALGGAIYAGTDAIVKVRDNDFGNYCAAFEFNKANNGAAVYSTGANSLNIDYSSFRYNTLTGSNGYIQIVHYPTTEFGIATALSPLVMDPNETDGFPPDAYSGNVTVGTLGLPPFGSMPAFNCDSKIPLEYFGVVTNGNWNTGELEKIRKGVTRTGAAFSTLTNTYPHIAFRRVFLNNNPSNWQIIQINKAALGGIWCETSAPNIECDDNISITPFTISHELGHVFVTRTGGTITGSLSSFYSLVDNPNDEYFCNTALIGSIYDNSPNCNSIVFGRRLDDFLRPDWARGGRGWGSAPTPLPNPSNFQQNPYTILDGDDTSLTGEFKLKKRDEAAADMFLNWVHSRISKGGFADISWLGSCSTSGCPDNTLPGQARYQWMTQSMSTLFGLYSW